VELAEKTDDRRELTLLEDARSDTLSSVALALLIMAISASSASSSEVESSSESFLGALEDAESIE
jgi:exo-beta-1,3-glucanase (GH17 family)